MSSPPGPSQATEELRRLVAEEGFDLFGVAAATGLSAEGADLLEWLAQGRHGDMAWLERDPGRRADPRAVLQGCQSVVMLGAAYLREPLPADPGQPPPVGFGRVSKYARGRDYHRVFEKRLRRLARLIDREIVPGAQTRPYVDYGPVMERPWAARAGLGFAGKHTLLIDPQRGSYFLLGTLLTTAELEPHQRPPGATAVGCGDCRRCIDACPTGAITEPWRFDARRCLSFLTIEKQGPVDEAFWPHYRGNLFGCDICQDVCPYNRSRAMPGAADMFGPPLVEGTVPLAALLADPEGFLERFGDSATPLRRAGAESLLRNAAIVASEQGDPAALEALHHAAADDRRPHWLRNLATTAANRLSARIPKGP